VEPVETTDPDGVDHAWVMQTTFVATILVGAPVVAVLSVGQSLPTWGARALFAVRVGALVWFVTAVAVYAVARRRAAEAADDEADPTGSGAGEGGREPDGGPDTG
jgi:hypothetical protein